MQTYLFVIISILFLNILPIGNKKRTRIILPISFIILWAFLAFRYDYGVDYINYKQLFYDFDEQSRTAKNEPLFWNIFKSFEYYYQFIIFQTTAICLTFYYFVRKYIVPQYYWLFFLLFICHSGIMFTITTAMRSGFAAMVFMWGTELFYLRKSKPLLYFLSIYLAYLFHNSAILLILFPFADLIIKKLSQKGWIVLTFIGLFISVTSIRDYLGLIMEQLSDSAAISEYSYYLEERFANLSITVAITRLIFVLPSFFLFKNILFNKDIEPEYRKTASITLLFMIMHIIGIDFQNRLLVCICILYIISMLKLLVTTSNRPIIHYTTLGFIIFSTIWSCYVMFTIQAIEQPEGSFWYYQTIFDIPRLP